MHINNLTIPDLQWIILILILLAGFTSMHFYCLWEQQAKDRIRALKKRLVELDSQEETESPQKGWSVKPKAMK
jgi:hypothetical protein